MTTNNHPANGPVSLERLHQIREILSKSAAQSDGGNLGYAMADAVKVIDGAIAARNAEPVAIVQPSDYVTAAELVGEEQTRKAVHELYEGALRIGDKLYRHPQEWQSKQMSCPKCNDTGMADSGGVQPWGEPILIECDCRDAMLQGAETVSNSDELPLDYRQGHKDGLEWAAQLAEANHPQTGDWLYDDPIELVRAIRKGQDMPTVQAGNSQVTPDGWQLVPKEPTEAMNKAGWAAMNEHDAINPTYRAMLEAAPQQEPPKSDVIGSYQGADGKDHPIVTFSSPQQGVKS